MTAAATTDCMELARELGAALVIVDDDDDDSGFGCMMWPGVFP